MKTIKLSRAYTVGSSQFAEVTFRAPRLLDYRQIGRAIELQRGVVVTYPDAIWGYVDRLVTDVSAGALGELDLIDALEVEEAIIGFFTEANKARQKPESSFSGSSGNPPTSTA